MSNNKKRSSLSLAIGIALGFSAAAVYAGSISDTYTTGQTLSATMMDNIKNAVNDSNTRLTTVESGKGTCAGNPDVTGDTMVRVGSVCVDKYEASISGGVARSLPNVAPAAGVNYFQAADACVKAHKRLLTNAEWQMAATGTPLGGSGCNGSGTLANTGASASCVSSYGVMDMAGNVSEWVADIVGTNAVDVSTGAVGVLRGGDTTDGVSAGPNYMVSGTTPVDTTLGNAADANRGFRCGR